MVAELGTSLIILVSLKWWLIVFLVFLDECLGECFAGGLDFFNSNQVRSLFRQQIQVLIIEALLDVTVWVRG